MVNNTWVGRDFNIHRLNMTAENRALLSGKLKQARTSGGSTSIDFQTPIPTYKGDSITISAEAKEMLNAQQPSTSNEEREAVGLRFREIPMITEREFTIFSRNVLEEHMEDAHRHLALMKRAILDPSRFSNADLTLEERTIMREGILQEAQRIADTYLSGEAAQCFIEGFENLIREAEMMERGYVRDSWHGTLSMMMLDGSPFRSPYSQPDIHALTRFVEGNMTDVQRAEFDTLSNEVNRLSDLIQLVATGGNSEMSFQEILDTFDEATAALRTFVESMGEYHRFQEQWDLWQSGEYPSNNWFANASAAFEENSANVAAQIEEIRFEFRNQFGHNGADAFRSLFEQINNSNVENLFLQWLTQLSIFNLTE